MLSERENKNDHKTDVTVEDANPIAVRRFLEYLYTQDTELIESITSGDTEHFMQDLAHLAIVADRYNIVGLLTLIQHGIQDFEMKDRSSMSLAKPRSLAKDVLLAIMILRKSCADSISGWLQALQGQLLCLLVSTSLLRSMDTSIEALFKDCIRAVTNLAVTMIKHYAGGQIYHSDLGPAHDGEVLPVEDHCS